MIWTPETTHSPLEIALNAIEATVNGLIRDLEATPEETPEATDNTPEQKDGNP